MATTAVEDDNNTNPIYLTVVGKFTKEEIENANKAADHWYDKMSRNPSRY